MKRIILGIVLGFTLVEGAFAECTYSMNGVINEVGASGFPSIIGQKASYTFQATADKIEYIAQHPDYSPQSLTGGLVNLPTSGITAFDYQTKVLPYDLPGTEGSMQGYSLVGVDSNGKLHSISFAYSNNTAVQNYKRTLLIMHFGPAQNSNTLELKNAIVKPYSASAIQNLGIYINQNSNKYGLIINNIDEGYVGEFSSHIDKVVYNYQAAIYKVPTTSTNIGKPLSMELITDHARMVSSFPTGAKDICGNTI